MGSSRARRSRAAISVTAGTITSAASIMVVVFAAFVTLKFVFIQQLGLGLAVAVFIDATIVRCVLLPASMTAPRRLELVAATASCDWLPQVTIEGEGLELAKPEGS